ncbi:potassium-transporting ATPase subunit KdpA [Streptomyces sp. TS71-3]|uniref:potassium-transporting ATPase subunit KdpA n=1 Tax=Streptomyces sp. TS71-3 TaxID=2733862 RepID=UPI0027E326E7|nr:potassium-transporting ATPase subunit KdpA [Streptomyces sp. TS71-3]
MLIGRYVPMVFLLALAARLARQRPGAVTVGTLQARGVNFVALATAAGPHPGPAQLPPGAVAGAAGGGPALTGPARPVRTGRAG